MTCTPTCLPSIIALISLSLLICGLSAATISATPISTLQDPIHAKLTNSPSLLGTPVAQSTTVQNTVVPTVMKTTVAIPNAAVGQSQTSQQTSATASSSSSSSVVNQSKAVVTNGIATSNNLNKNSSNNGTLSGNGSTSIPTPNKTDSKTINASISKAEVFKTDITSLLSTMQSSSLNLPADSVDKLINELITLYIMLLEYHSDSTNVVLIEKLNKQVTIIIGLVEDIKSYIMNPNLKKGNTVTGNKNNVIGMGNNIQGNNVSVLGMNNTAVGNNSSVRGLNNTAVINNSTVFGKDTFVVGNNVSVKANNSVVFSKNQQVNTSNTLVVDAYSLNIDQDPNTGLGVKWLG